MTIALPIVSAHWLSDHLTDPRVVTIDCRFSLQQPELGRQLYHTSHIPGAHYLDLNRDLSGPVGSHGGRHPLPNPVTLATTLSALGIHSEPPDGPTLVVAYDDSRLAFASRLWWLLRYLGHDSVALLDGGWSAWQGQNLPVTNEVSHATSGNFTPCPRPDMVVDMERVKARKECPGVALIDAREGDRYRGEREPIDPIAGHIPGALNFPWQDATDSNGYLRPSGEHKKRWEPINHTEEVIVYCGSGVTACVNILSLELADIRMGEISKLYVGSWSDWCSSVQNDA